MNGHIWRLLEVGEVKCKGDEFYDDPYGWRGLESVNGQIGGVIDDSHRPHRRLVPYPLSEAEKAWDALPASDLTWMHYRTFIEAFNAGKGSK